MRSLISPLLISSLLISSLLIVAAVPAALACGGGDGAQSDRADIVDTARAAGSFQTLLAAASAAGLVDTLKSDGPFTVFAPTDDAFAKLPAGTVEALLKDPARLRAVLTYHVVPGRVTAAQVARLDSARTVHGADVAIRGEGGTVMVGEARVLRADIVASNGVIHVIDAVILPPTGKRTAGR